MTVDTLVELAKRMPFLSRSAPIPDLSALSLIPVAGVTDARAAFYDTGRDYLKVEAQGDLTGWLAKHAYSDYGGVWNQKAKEYGGAVSPITESVVFPLTLDSDFERDLRSFLRSMLVLHAMESFYSKHPKRPKFFSSMIAILESGHLPCGCILPWPSKSILVF